MCMFLLAFTYFFNVSYASTGTVYLKGDKTTLGKGEEINLALCIANAETAAYTAYLYFDNSKLEYVSGPENTNVVGNRIIYVWYDENGGSNPKKGELASFKFKAKEEGRATFNIQGEFYGNDGRQIETDLKETDVQIGKEETISSRKTEEVDQANNESNNAEFNNAELTMLRLGIEGIVPEFKKDVYDYYLTVENSINDIDIVAISENPKAVVEITGNTNLKEGLNIITIRVTSEDKTQSNVYTIQVTKTNNYEAANTNLEILAIENVLLNPPFDTNVTHYSVEVSNETDNVNVFAVPENENANVKIVKGETLNEGENLIKVSVTAQNGFSSKAYEITVYKRNQEEEAKYREEQEANKQQLEEIYEAEKTSNELGQVEKENKTWNSIMTGGIIVGLIVIGGLIVWRYKAKKKIN